MITRMVLLLGIDTYHHPIFIINIFFFSSINKNILPEERKRHHFYTLLIYKIILTGTQDRESFSVEKPNNADHDIHSGIHSDLPGAFRLANSSCSKSCERGLESQTEGRKKKK